MKAGGVALRGAHYKEEVEEAKVEKYSEESFGSAGV